PAATAPRMHRRIGELADLPSPSSPELDRDTVYQTLNLRERPASTGIGDGFAIPRGRLNGIDQPIICAMLLDQGLDFDAIDNRPVRCVVGLLVPADANQTHLQLLARLARAFSQPATQQRIRACEADERISRAVT